MSCPRQRVYGCGNKNNSWSYSWSTVNGVTTVQTTGNVSSTVVKTPATQTQQQCSGNVSNVPGAAVSTSKDYYEVGLKMHNWYRKRHGSPKMVLSDRLNKCADEYAYKLACQKRLVHTSGLDYNENLFMSSDTSASKNELVRQACKAWYDEIKLYNFSNPGFSMQTGHFTAMVWKATSQLGIGCWGANGCVVVVACYKPHVNFQGQFGSNVLPWRNVEDSDDEQEERKIVAKVVEKVVEKKEVTKVETPSKDENESDLHEDAVQAFKSKADKKETIGWSELKQLLNENVEVQFKFNGFDKAICSLLISMITIREGEKTRINVGDFGRILQSIEGFLDAYTKFDKDNSGSLDPFEFKSALDEGGYNISYKTFKMLQKILMCAGDDDNGNMEMDFRGSALCFILLSKLQIVKQQKAANEMMEDFSMKDWMEDQLKAASAE